MLKLVVSELRANGSVWLPATVALIVGGACAGGVMIAISTGLRTSGLASAGDAAEGIRTLGTTIQLLTLCTAAGVVGSTTSFVLSAQAREHALWRIQGFTPRQLKWTLRMLMACLAAIAGVIAVPLAFAAAFAVLRQWSSIGIIAEGQGPILELWHPMLIMLLIQVATAWGTWTPTRRASTVSEMVALRESRAHRTRVGCLRGAMAIALFAAGVAMLVVVLARPLSGQDDRAAGALSGLLVVILATLLVPSWTIRPLLWLWTGALPLASQEWRFARESCRFAAGRSLATVVPFAIATSLVAVLYGGGAISGGGTSLAEVGVLMGPTLIVSWVGGVCVMIMISGERSRDQAVLESMGAPPGFLRRASVVEGTVYAVTACLYGLVFLTATVLLVWAVTDVSLGDALRGLPWGHLTALVALTLLTSIGAVTLSTRGMSHVISSKNLPDNHHAKRRTKGAST